MFVLILSPYAFASPEFEGETVRISFASELDAVVAEPFGRWMDELFAMITVRAERLLWEDGALTEIFFQVDGKDACSIGLLRLEHDIFACGTLLPEGPVPLSGSQKELFVAWPDSLFAAKGEDAHARYSLKGEELATALREGALTCLALRVDADDYGSLDAVAHLLDTIAGLIEEKGENRILFTVELEDETALYGYMGEEIDLDMLDGLAEEILSRFINTMMWSIALMDEDPAPESIEEKTTPEDIAPAPPSGA